MGKSADFMRNFGGKLRQGSISKKQPISLGFLMANLAKIDEFGVDMTSISERFFFNRDNHYFALSTTVHSTNERMLKL